MSRPAFEYLVKDALLADPEIAGIIADRMYPLVRKPHSAYPCCTYSVGSDPLVWGALGEARMQVSCFAMIYDDVRALELRVRDVLDGMAIDGDGIEISGIDVDLPGLRTYEPQTGVYHHAIDCMVTYIYR